MKKILPLLFLTLTTVASAQNPTAYFMESSILRSQYNPAFAPLRGYVNIPMLGGVSINTGGNISLDNILFPRNGKLVTLIDSSVSSEDALRNLKTENLLGADARVNLIGFGAFARNHRSFWSVDINARVNSDINLPYSLFEFLKKGSSTTIRDIGVSADSYLEACFSYSFPVLKDRMYIGIRGKFLMGVARARMYYDHFDVSLDEDKWVVDASGALEITAGGQKIETTPNESGEMSYKFDNISIKPTTPVGYGFAVDLGATFDILPCLQASLAVNDLGFISWDKKHNTTGVSSSRLEFSGMEIVDGNTSPQPDFNFNIMEFQQRTPQSSMRMLRATVNAGLEYEVWRHKIGFGVLYSARMWEYKTLHNITGSINFHPIQWFTITGSYSMIDNRGSAVGLALNIAPNWINFFVATDIITSKHTPQFIPIKQSAMNVTLGIGIPIGRHSHRIAAYNGSSGKVGW